MTPPPTDPFPLFISSYHYISFKNTILRMFLHALTPNWLLMPGEKNPNCLWESTQVWQWASFEASHQHFFPTTDGDKLPGSCLPSDAFSCQDGFAQGDPLPGMSPISPTFAWHICPSKLCLEVFRGPSKPASGKPLPYALQLAAPWALGP